MDVFDEVLGMMRVDKTPYYCVKCNFLLEKIIVKTLESGYRKLFYCKNNKCNKFGIITVVAKKNR